MIDKDTTVLESLVEGMSARLERVERQNRSLKRLNVAILVGCLLVLAAGAWRPEAAKTIEAESLILRDKEGKIRATLSPGLGDNASLVLLDQNQMPRLMAGLMKDGDPFISLKGAQGKNRASLIANSKNDSSSFQLSDDEGKPRATMSLLSDGTPSLVLSDRDGRQKADLSLTKDGHPKLSLMDSDGKTGITLRLFENQIPSLVITDAAGTARMTFALLQGQKPTIFLVDKDKRLRLNASLNRDGVPRFILLDENAQSLFHVP